MWRDKIGVLFGASLEVNMEVARIIPIFLVSVPFVAIARITISSLYASKKTVLAYFLIFIEPVLMLIFMLFLPPLFGGQIMIWWSTVFARILSALLAWLMKVYVDKREFSYA
jgi:Na+-driven multidrug efflux pump